MNFSAVIFDFFGTLVPNFSLREHKLTLARMAHVLGAETNDFISLWFDTFEERVVGAFPTVEANIAHVCRVLRLEATPASISTATSIRFDFERRNLIPRSGAVETLARIRTAGYSLGLITDCSAELPLLWAESPFPPLFHTVVFSSTVGLRKPDPRIYLLATEALRVVPSACLYVGDGGGRELSGARSVGMFPVMLRSPGEDTDDIHRIDGESWDGTCISRIEEVLDILGAS